MSEAARWTLLLGLIVIAPTQSGAANPGARRPAITIYVDNRSDVDYKTQLKAEKVASEIFRKAGVEIRWLDAGLHSDARQGNVANLESLDISGMRLCVVSEAAADSFSLPTNVMGLAPGTGLDRRYVYVFYSRVKELSLRQINVYRKGIVSRPATVDQILGAMIAHELGHVLLNLPSHSPTGIMRGYWDLRDLENIAYNGLLFTAPQAEVMQADVIRRAGKQQAVEFAGT